MMKKIISSIFIAITFYVTLSLYVSPRLYATEITNDHLEAEVFQFPNGIDENGEFYIVFKIKVRENFHINAHIPSEDYLVPTEISISDHESVEVLDILYPKPHTLYLDFAEKEVDVYDGAFYMAIKAKKRESYSEGTLSLKADFSYQACDDKACYMPKVISKEVMVDLNPSFNSTTLPLWLKNLTEKDTNTSGNKSILLYFIFGFIGGLILNVMPCVLPVISIKALSLVEKSQAGTKSFRWNNLAFIAGIFATFYVIASLVIILKLSGESVGWGFQFQNPYFLYFITCIIFAFSLNLVGFFNVDAPISGNIVNKINDYEGYLKSFFEGMLITILATPCTAPFLGTALGFAFSQTIIVIYCIFTAIALGLSFPFLLLFFSQDVIKWIPKPGLWMNTFKKIMSIPLFLTVAWLLYILWKVTSHEVIATVMAALLFIGLSLIVIGRLSTPFHSRKMKIASWILGLLFFYILFHVFVHPAINTSQKENKKISMKDIVIHEAKWRPFSDKEFKEAIRKDGMVFIDFTATWCLTCQLNKKNVLHKKAISRLFNDENVRLFVADWTANDPVITDYLRQFGRAGVPLYVLYPKKNKKEPIILPEILTKEILENAIREAKFK